MKSRSTYFSHETFILTRTRLGLPVVGFNWVPRSREGQSARAMPKILILGGVHGDEIEGVVCAWGVMEELLQMKEGDSRALAAEITLIPQFNPEGVLQKSRLNSAGVDLNRNLPTKDWNPQKFNDRYPPGPFANSEPENQALVKWISDHSPHLIVSLHSWKPMLNVNGDCRLLAKKISEQTGYRIEESIGYPTPGCLGTYAGLERNHPTLTYEVERGLALDEVVRVHPQALLNGISASIHGSAS